MIHVLMSPCSHLLLFLMEMLQKKYHQNLMFSVVNEIKISLLDNLRYFRITFQASSTSGKDTSC